MENNLLLDRVAFTIFGFEIYWYGIFMCAAIISAIVVAMFFCKKRGMSIDEPINVALVSVPSGILMGRLFAVLFDDSLKMSEYLNFRTGGMSIIGCVIGGGLALAIYSFIKKDKEIFKYTDIICSVLLLAQAIGRWGNFFNGEIFGQVIVNGDSIFSRFPFAVTINGVKYQALFFYESIINIVGFFFTAEIFLFVKKDGYTTGFYLTYYGVVRTILEKFRQDQFILKIGNAPISMICSIVMIVVGITILAISIYRNKKKKDAK